MTLSSGTGVRAGGVMSTVAYATPVCAVFVLTLAWRVLTFSGFSNDHYVHLARAQQMYLGDWPVRDFVDPGLPLMYATSAAAWHLWGGSIGTEVVLVAAAFAVAAACTFHVACRLSGSVTIALLATVLEVMIAPRSYSYPKVMLYAVAAWVIVAVAVSPSVRRLWLLAGLIVVAFLFRHDHGIYIGAGAGVVVAAVSYSDGRQLVVRRLGLLGGSVALLLVPWLAFVERHQGVVDYFTSGVAFYRAEAARTSLRSLPRPTLSWSEDWVRIRPAYQPVATIQWVEEVTEAERRVLERRHRLDPAPGPDDSALTYYVRDPSPAGLRALADDPRVASSAGLGRVAEWSLSPQRRFFAALSPSRVQVQSGLHLEENSYVWLFYLFHALPLAAMIVVWRRSVHGPTRWPGEEAAMLAIAVMAVLANVGFIRGSLNVWLPDAVAPAAVLAAWLLAWARGREGGWGLKAARRARLGVVVVTVIATAHVGSFAAQIDRTDARRGPGAVLDRARELASTLARSHREAGLPPSSVSGALLPLLAYFDRCTLSLRDRFVMTGLFPDVFVMAERGFAGGHIAFIEGFYTSAIEQERTVARLSRQSVPFVIVLRDFERQFHQQFPLISAYVDRRYDTLVDLPVPETSGVRVLVDREMEALRADDDTGWPCFR